MIRRMILAAFLLCLTARCFGDEVTFEGDVRPILKAHCFQCHGEAGEKKGGLDLRLRRLMAKGGDSGEAFVAGKPGESLLLERVRSGEMPPGEEKQLSPAEITTLEKWIAAGAPTKRAEPESIGDGPSFTEEERGYWAFQPVVRPALPEIKDTSRVRSPVDIFILARGSGFAPDADRNRLLRRAYFDLLGLPTTPEAIVEFERDCQRSPDAWEKLVDRLLSSPHYGERWGRHWLDVAGYADSEGYTDEDRVRPHAWRYRDYVTRSFNDDKPFSQFIVEQIAGSRARGELAVGSPDDQGREFSVSCLFAGETVCGRQRFLPITAGTPQPNKRCQPVLYRLYSNLVLQNLVLCGNQFPVRMK